MTPTNDAESRARFQKHWNSGCGQSECPEQAAFDTWQARDAEVAAKDARISELLTLLDYTADKGSRLMEQRDQLREQYDALIAVHEQLKTKFNNDK